jgi:hypothetical protein
MAQSIWQWATSWTAGVRFPVETRDFSLLHCIQTGYGAHPVSYPMGNEGSFSKGKWQGREAGHSPPAIAEVKNGGVTSTTPYVFMVWCLINRA